MPKSFLISRSLEDVLEPARKCVKISENGVSYDAKAICAETVSSSSVSSSRRSQRQDFSISDKPEDAWPLPNQEASSMETTKHTFICCNKSMDGYVGTEQTTPTKRSDHISLHRPKDKENDIYIHNLIAGSTGRDAKRALSFSDAKFHQESQMANSTDQNSNEEISRTCGTRCEETSCEIDSCSTTEKVKDGDLLSSFYQPDSLSTFSQNSHSPGCSVLSDGSYIPGYVSDFSRSLGARNHRDLNQVPNSGRCTDEVCPDGHELSEIQKKFHLYELSKPYHFQNMRIFQKPSDHLGKSDAQHRLHDERLPIPDETSLKLPLEYGKYVKGEMLSLPDRRFLPLQQPPHHKIHASSDISDSQRLPLSSTFHPWLGGCYDKCATSTGTLEDPCVKESQYNDVRLSSVSKAETKKDHHAVGKEIREPTNDSHHMPTVMSGSDLALHPTRLPNPPPISPSKLQCVPPIPWLPSHAVQNHIQLPTHKPHAPIISSEHPYNQRFLHPSFQLNGQAMEINGKHLLDRRNIMPLPITTQDLKPNKYTSSAPVLPEYERDSTSDSAANAELLQKQTAFVPSITCDPRPFLNFNKAPSCVTYIPNSSSTNVCSPHHPLVEQESRDNNRKDDQTVSTCGPERLPVIKMSPSVKKHSKRSRPLKSFTISSIMDDHSDSENENCQDVSVSSDVTSSVKNECKSSESLKNLAECSLQNSQTPHPFDAMRNVASQKDHETQILRSLPHLSSEKDIERNSVRSLPSDSVLENSIQQVHPPPLQKQSEFVCKERTASLVKSDNVPSSEKEENIISQNSWDPKTSQPNLCDLPSKDNDTLRQRNGFFLAKNGSKSLLRPDVARLGVPNQASHQTLKSPSLDSNKGTGLTKHSISAPTPDNRRPPEIQIPHHLFGNPLWQNLPFNHSSLRLNPGGIYQPIPMRFNPHMPLPHPIINNNHVPGSISTYPTIPVNSNSIPSPSKAKGHVDLKNYSDKKDIRSPASDAASVMSSDLHSPTSSSVSSPTSPVRATSLSPGRGRQHDVTPSANQCLERSYLKLGLDFGKQGSTGKHEFEEGKSFKAFLETFNVKLEFINNRNGIKNPLLSTEFAENKLAIMSNNCSLPCPVCNLTFDTAKDLQRHLKDHREMKRFLCTFCGKGFNDTFDLKRHSRTHTGVRPYKCNQCDKAFTQRCSLESHSRKIHGLVESLAFNERRVKLFVCEVCGHATDMAEEHYTHVRHAHQLNHLKGIVDTSNPVAAL